MTENETLGEGTVTRGETTGGEVTGGNATGSVTADGVDWEAVRDDYLYGGMAQRRIAWKHGISAARLRTRRVAEGWERVAPCVPLPTRRVTPRDGEPPTPTQQKRARLIKRLYTLLDGKMATLETRMAEGKEGPHNAADAERDMRTITTMMQFYTKLVAMDDAARAADGATRRDGARTDDDADRLRRDLAERLARLGAGDT